MIYVASTVDYFEVDEVVMQQKSDCIWPELEMHDLKDVTLPLARQRSARDLSIRIFFIFFTS